LAARFVAALTFRADSFFSTFISHFLISKLPMRLRFYGCV
jgi:hypothetical protein